MDLLGVFRVMTGFKDSSRFFRRGRMNSLRKQSLSDKRGFALIVALSLMGFLLLLLLSLSTLIQVQLAGVQQEKAKLAARENARYGLMVALGELQRLAGPDQRVTATPLVGLSGQLTSLQNANWVGVYDSNPSSTDFEDLTGTAQSNERWLISGDRTVMQPDSFDSGSILGAGNKVTNSEIDNYVVLVGENSAAIDLSGNGNSSGSINDVFDIDLDADMTESISRKANYIVAGIEPVRSLDLDGGFAWWIGDEGTKADISLSDLTSRLENSNPSDSDLIKVIRQNGTQHSGLNGIFQEGYSEYGTATFDEREASKALNQVSTLNQLSMLENGGNTQSISDHVAQSRFHHLTAGRYGILTNTLDGGLRMNIDKTSAINSAYNGDVTSVDPTNIFTNGSFGWDPDDTSFSNNYFDTDSLFTTTNQFGARDVPLAKAHEHFVQQNELVDGQFPEYEPYLNLGPIITELRVRFSVFQRSGRATLRYYIEAEIFNPHSHHLLLANNNNTRAFSILLEGLPEIQVVNASTSESSHWQQIDTIALDSGATEVASWMAMTFHPSAYNGAPYLRPGEVFQIADPDPTVQDQGLVMYFNGDIGSVSAQNRIRVRLRKPASEPDATFTVKLLEGYGGSRNNSDPVFELTNIPYFPDGQENDIFEFEMNADGGDDPKYIYGSGSGSNIDIRASFVFSFVYRFKGTTSSTVTEEWLGSVDLRQPSIDYKAQYQSRDGTMKNYSDLIETGIDPFGAEAAISGLFDGSDFFADNTDSPPTTNNPRRRQNTGTYRDIRLYDMPFGYVGSAAGASSSSISTPVTPLTSIASLRAFPLGQTPPYVLGESFGAQVPFYNQPAGASATNNINLAFDKYFFSSIPDDNYDWDGYDNSVLPNTRMLMLERSSPKPTRQQLRAPDAAKHLIVEGMFNINSLSPEAWSSLLAQNREWWHQELQYTMTGNGSSPPTPYTMSETAYSGSALLTNAFFRFPFNAYYWGSKVARDDEIGNTISLTDFQEDYQFQQPVRVLDSANGNTQIRQLAYHIVSLVKQEGPFMSVSDFINHSVTDNGVNKGLLQAAIDRVGPAIGSIPSCDPINQDITPYSNAYLTQGDIIAAIAPVLSARSDTFLIRAYGETRNPITQEVNAKAYLEAKVQRMVTKIDGSDVNTNAASASDGREFRILSTRWLSDSEI